MSQLIRGNPTLSATTPSVSAGCATTKNKDAPSLAIQVAPVGLEGVAKHARPKSAVPTLLPPVEAVAHTHRILVDSPNGPTVEGHCACGYTRTYSSSGDDEAGLWPVAMKAKRLKGGDVVKAKKGGARSVNQAQAFYGALR